jgi:hypothetical protein
MRYLGPLALCLFLVPAVVGQDFTLKYFGEDPDQEYSPTPDQSDATENWARHGDHAGGRLPKGPVEDPPKAPEPEEEDVPDVDWPTGKPPAYGEDREVVPVPRRWPGPRRPARRAAIANPMRKATKPPENDIVDSDEQLRDAPGPANYSLWKNLSTPLMLPAQKVAEASPADAKNLGRQDYERTIFGIKGRQGAVPVSPYGKALPTAKGHGIYVTVELRVDDFSTEYAPRAARFARENGFKLDKSMPPEAGNGRVKIHGWLKPNAFGRAAASDFVARIQSKNLHRSGKPLGGPSTEILVGLRIPPESTPTTVLREVAQRLARDADFELDRVVGYQRIPGTSRMVLVISGRVPVRRIGKLMADAAVVKTVPAPRKDRPSVRRASVGPESIFKKFVRFQRSHRSAVALVLVLIAFSMVSTSFARRRRPRYR